MSMRGTERSGDRRRWRLVGASAAVLAALTTDVLLDGPVTRHERSRVWKRTRFAAPWAMVTELGDRPALAAMTTLAAAAAVVRGRDPVVPVVAVTTAYAGRWGLMRAVGRDRPPEEDWLVRPEGASYPSRHAASAMLGALCLHRQLPRSSALDAVLSLGVVAVCVSRVRLGVHWPSDVVAGVALATLVHALIDQPQEVR
jgi:undecaprenyl-diphosphatase